jgi:hypothetical protein
MSGMSNEIICIATYFSPTLQPAPLNKKNQILSAYED